VHRGIYATTFDEDVPTDEQPHDQQTCPECDGRVTTNSHETACERCGLVLDEDRIDPGPEWRSFDAEQRPAERTGAPRTAARHDHGLSTRIGHRRATTDQQFSGRKRRRLTRLRREQRRAKTDSKRERNQVYAFTEIRRLVSALGLATSDRDQACQLFRTAQQADLLRGRSLEAMSAAVVYAVCRITGQPQTLADMAPVARVDRSTVANAYGVLNRELELPAQPPEPTAYLPRLVSALGLPPAVERQARALLTERADATGVGASPPGVAGGAILVAAADCGERGRFTQAALADAAGVTPVTLRTHRDALRSGA
jgi:transcription initiation factor TFIIB